MSTDGSPSTTRSKQEQTSGRSTTAHGATRGSNQRTKAPKRPRAALTDKETEERRRRNRESAAFYRKRQRETMQFWQTTAEQSMACLRRAQEELLHERSMRLHLERVLSQLLMTGGVLPAKMESQVDAAASMLPRSTESWLAASEAGMPHAHHLHASGNPAVSMAASTNAVWVDSSGRRDAPDESLADMIAASLQPHGSS